jgi:hypothetical protein
MCVGCLQISDSPINSWFITDYFRPLYVIVRGVGLVALISLPMVPGSIRAAVSLAADSSVCDFTQWYKALTVRKQWQTTGV